MTKSELQSLKRIEAAKEKIIKGIDLTPRVVHQLTTEVVGLRSTTS